MRILLIASILLFFFSCTQNSSSSNSEGSSVIEDGNEKAIFVSSQKGRKALNFTGGVPVAKEDRIKRPKTDKAKITGRINGEIGNRVKFTNKATAGEKGSAKRIFLRKDSTFKSKITVGSKGKFYILNYNAKNYEVFLTPGDSLDITFNTEDEVKPVVFSGIGAGHNNYLLNRVYYEKELSMKKSDLFKLDYKKFSDSLDFKRDNLLKHLQHVAGITADFTDQFAKQERNTLDLDWALDHMKYKTLSKKYAPTGYEERIADFNYDFLKQLKMDDPGLVNIKEFRELVKSYFDAKVDPQIAEKVPGNPAWTEIAVARHKLKYEAVDDYFKHENVRDYLRTEIVDNLVRENGSPSMNELVLRFRKEVENKAYQEKVQKSIDKFAYIEDGALAPELIMEDVAGEEIALSDFRGKYLYIDVWASWCGPCHHEIPYFDRLKNEYKGKNIEFISISIDRSQAPWKQFLYDRKMYKNQYYVNGIGPSDLSSKYKIQGLPQFILIDPEGQIVDLSATRPSGRIRNDLAMLGL